jgi:hypothetical protein
LEDVGSAGEQYVVRRASAVDAEKKLLAGARVAKRNIHTPVPVECTNIPFAPLPLVYKSVALEPGSARHVDPMLIDAVCVLGAVHDRAKPSEAAVGHL